jgi:NAD(P)-dependent dehydrogenase (short-subunit alcohol dehydrogenase family)
MKIAERLQVPSGLRVLITGGAAGIGATIAAGFHDTGAQVFICDIDANAVDRMRRDYPGLQGAVVDVGAREDVDRVMDEAMAALGGLDVLVNNAGIAGPTGGIDELDAAAWEQTVSTNLNSQFYFLRKAVPFLKKSECNPHIIAMSSVAGRLGYAFRTPYASTKWAIVGLMKTLANELGPDNVRVNAILPGVVAGERMSRVMRDRAKALGISDEAMHAQYMDKISLRRMVSMEDIAAMALFLSTPAAMNITGQAISVDGNVEYL